MKKWLTVIGLLLCSAVCSADQWVLFGETDKGRILVDTTSAHVDKDVIYMKFRTASFTTPPLVMTVWATTMLSDCKLGTGEMIFIPPDPYKPWSVIWVTGGTRAHDIQAAFMCSLTAKPTHEHLR